MCVEACLSAVCTSAGGYACVNVHRCLCVNVGHPQPSQKLSQASPKAPPMQWAHANLEPLRLFLLAEQAAGRYRPLCPLPI